LHSNGEQPRKPPADQAAPKKRSGPANGPATQDPWSLARARETYQIDGWGDPYFFINDKGHVAVRASPDATCDTDLYELVRDLQERGTDLPILLRFPGILRDRIRVLNEAFAKAIAEYQYPGRYQGVFPVKVNQQRHVVEEVVKHGRQWDYGLEAGSKPELLIALAAMENSDGLVICNGYKDQKYIETALIAQQFGRTVILVMERLEELDLCFAAADRLGLKPILGVRAKLSAKGIGRWADSAGDRAKFGLTTPEIVRVIDRLQERGWLDCMQLLHFHIGSQVSSITPWKNALREASQFYVELHRLGCGMRYLDIGGGLAVDYDGSKTDFAASKNYEVLEYAHDVVAAIQSACDKANVPPPTIVNESGRAVAAYQSVLVFGVLGTNRLEITEALEPAAGSHAVLTEIFGTLKNVRPKNLQESWHDALQAREEAESLFKFGYLNLRDRAHAERLFYHCARKIAELAKRLKFVPEEIQDLDRVLSDIYYCNFSIFQSAPDCWAIDQLFPIMPIHRLDEEPGVRARVADLTCDSDGVIDHFIDVDEVKSVLALHEFKASEPYVLGMFLNGAYQEILGDLHNLFGDTNVAHVEITDEGYHIIESLDGDSIAEVLQYVNYDPKMLINQVRRQAEVALSKGRISLAQMRLLLRHYEEALRSYTYLTEEEQPPPSPEPR
jgi:arginine decarboxylase